MSELRPITQIVMPGGNREPVMADAEQKKNALKAADALQDAFNWSRSAEGFDFWDSVHARLLGIGNGEEPLR